MTRAFKQDAYRLFVNCIPLYPIGGGGVLLNPGCRPPPPGGRPPPLDADPYVCGQNITLPQSSFSSGNEELDREETSLAPTLPYAPPHPPWIRHWTGGSTLSISHL